MHEDLNVGSDIYGSSTAYDQKSELVLPSTRYSVRDGRGERRAQVIAAWLALIVGMAGSLAIGCLLPSRWALARMFSPKRIESTIPALILVLFLWGLLLCRLRSRRLKAVKNVSSEAFLQPVLHHLEQAGPSQTSAALTSNIAVSSPLLRRAKAVLDQWCASPGLQNADVVLQEHVSRDEEELHNAYSLLRLFVWALPVMGLIGTVIGISLAVGGFAQFLSGSIDDVGAIKRNLVFVTGGLSFAFLITLEGLAASLLLMFLVSSLQNAESRFLLAVQKQIADRLVPALQSQEMATEMPQGSTADAIEQTRQILLDSSRSILGVIQDAASQLLSGIGANLQTQQAAVGDVSRQIDASTKSLADAMSRVSNCVNQAHEKMTADAVALQGVISGQREIFDAMLSNHKESVENAQAQVTSALDRQTQAFANNAQAVSQLMATAQSVMESHKAAQREVFHEMLTSHRAAVDNAQSELSAALGRQTQVIVDHSRGLDQLVSATSAVMESHRTAITQMNATDLSTPIKTMAEFATQLREQTRQAALLIQAFESMMRGTEAITHSHTALQNATKDLHELGLGKTLASVRDSLTALAPTLEGFRKPFVLRAVPADGDERA